MESINDENSPNVEYNSENVNELIIHYVRSLPQLWDLKNKEYRDNVLKKKLWCQVAQELNVTDEFVKNRWRQLRDRYLKEKKKSVTKSGQAAHHFFPWPLMASLSFLSDVVEPRKTVTNCQSFVIERPSSIDTSSSAPLETFETEGYMQNDTEEFQVDYMQDTNTRQAGQTQFCPPRPLSILSCRNSASPRPNSALSRPNSALSRPNSISPSPNSASPRSNSASPRPNSASPRPNSASPRPNSASPCPYSVSLNSALTRPPRAQSRPPSMSPHSESYSDSHSQQNQTQPAKRGKRQLTETRTDAVDQAILNFVEKRTSTDTMNSDDLFYLSISRDSQHLNVNAKLRLKTLVLQALSQVVAEEQNIT
ncbi:uncharacterized protein LOC143902126 [Temnothorax americanus]|uniref:uncharacterized protein LOC143902126 n=1 Tax=Temnothorax americanus TaxID=1964332 RepID=UPI004068CDCE